MTFIVECCSVCFAAIKLVIVFGMISMTSTARYQSPRKGASLCTAEVESTELADMRSDCLTPSSNSLTPSSTSLTPSSNSLTTSSNSLMPSTVATFSRRLASASRRLAPASRRVATASRHIVPASCRQATVSRLVLWHQSHAVYQHPHAV